MCIRAHLGQRERGPKSLHWTYRARAYIYIICSRNRDPYYSIHVHDVLGLFILEYIPRELLISPGALELYPAALCRPFSFMPFLLPFVFFSRPSLCMHRLFFLIIIIRLLYRNSLCAYELVSDCISSCNAPVRDYL